MTTSDVSETAALLEDSEQGWLIIAGWQVRLIQLLSVPGILMAYYLWLFHDGKVFPTCAAGGLFDCGQVSGPGAQFSSIGGVPVAFIGLLGNIAIFLLIWLKDWLPALDDAMPELLFGVTVLGFAFTVFLTALEAIVLGAFCQFCLVSAAIMTIMFVLSLLYLRSSRRTFSAND